MRLFLLLSVILFYSVVQAVELKGKIVDDSGPLVGAAVVLNGHTGVTTDAQGQFKINDLEQGEYTIEVRFVGYRSITKVIVLESDLDIELEMTPDYLGLSEVIVTANRSVSERYESTVIVRAIDDRIFDQTASVSMAEGLAFAPGLRLETNCQNCGFTQLRMNGLDGAYSQILIDNRPIFSSLAGVYGLEILPSQMIDRIEVVRGGGSALFGGNAIAGTVNVLTKEPTTPSFEVGTLQSMVNGEASDRTITFNGSVLNDDFKKGMTIFGSYREREAWDANGDGLTEMVELNNLSVGFNVYYRPTDRSKIKLSGSIITEYRRGGGDLEVQPHEANLAEALDHDILNAQLSYERYLPGDQSKISVYTSFQSVVRESYYGSGGRMLEPGDTLTESDLLALNAYGNSEDLSTVSGIQWNWNRSDQWAITAGSEFQLNHVVDEQPGYERRLDQAVWTWGTYAQAEININPRWSFSLGGRIDMVKIRATYVWPEILDENDQDLTVFVPRATLKYALSEQWRIRASYAQGYRAPQAFNEDLHIEMVGGEAVFTRLHPTLRPESSNSYNLSLQWAPYSNTLQFDFIVEGFYTGLSDVFFTGNLEPLPTGGSVRVVRNGTGASVYGTNIEFNGAYGSDWSWQSGLTIQAALYNEDEILWAPEEITDANVDSVVVTQNLIRTPPVYGYATFNYSGLERWTFSLSGILTGSMDVPHVIEAETGYTILERTRSFIDVNPKVSYHFDTPSRGHFELYTGVFNVFNSYQQDFDRGVNRDAGYVYGPTRPFTFYFGVKIGME